MTVQRLTVSDMAADCHELMVSYSSLFGHPIPALSDNGRAVEWVDVAPVNDNDNNDKDLFTLERPKGRIAAAEQGYVKQ